jgi:hypothetical protein
MISGRALSLLLLLFAPVLGFLPSPPTRWVTLTLTDRQSRFSHGAWILSF